MESGDHPPIFELFPDLREKISYINLDTKPTPVHRLENLGHKNLLIKRNDRISPVYGGNKVRRLEFVLGDVLDKKQNRVVTMGAIGTNHGLATAIFCKRLGLDCTLLLFDQPVTEYVRRNLLLFQYYGAEIIYTGTMDEAVQQFYVEQRQKYPEACFLDAGGTTTIGTIGQVNAAFEFSKQVDEGAMPMPKYIFCPTASNGTMAGLNLGFALAGIKTTVIGVRVGMEKWGDMELNTPNTVTALMKTVYDFLRENSDTVPDAQLPTPVMFNDYRGDGYGRLTKEGLDAVEIFKERESIELEPVYTGKTCAALLDFINDPVNAEDVILYWHTYNSVDLSKETQSVDYRDLPPDLHKFFEDK